MGKTYEIGKSLMWKSFAIQWRQSIWQSVPPGVQSMNKTICSIHRRRVAWKPDNYCKQRTICTLLCDTCSNTCNFNCESFKFKIWNSHIGDIFHISIWTFWSSSSTEVMIFVFVFMAVWSRQNLKTDRGKESTYFCANICILLMKLWK